ncbi:MAG: response regulator [Anaerolineae bacterium]|nr:MAG: response regulator [Anaerolineae bacterium]
MDKKQTILIIDDDEANRTLLGAMLEIGGFETLKASGGKPGLAILQVYEVDCVLLDVMMPEMDGFEVCRTIKTNPAKSATPVLMVTALADEPSRQRAFANGADGYLTKPIGFDRLLSQIRDIVEVHAELAAHTR